MSAINANPVYDYVLGLGDNSLVLGQRLSEWCGHGPALEEDIGLTNIALDLIGQARMLFSYAGELGGEGRTEDDLAFLRDSCDFRNLLLVEQPNRDFAYTIARQFFFDAYNLALYERLGDSSDSRLAEIAAKSVKEITYHLRHSSRWMIRLGDGTEESHVRIQQAADDLWMYTGELFEADTVADRMVVDGVGVSPQTLRPIWDERVDEVLREATLERPPEQWMTTGGRSGQHTEHLGYLLAEMQFLQRAYPGATW